MVALLFEWSSITLDRVQRVSQDALRGKATYSVVSIHNFETKIEDNELSIYSEDPQDVSDHTIEIEAIIEERPQIEPVRFFVFVTVNA